MPPETNISTLLISKEFEHTNTKDIKMIEPTLAAHPSPGYTNISIDTDTTIIFLEDS